METLRKIGIFIATPLLALSLFFGLTTYATTNYLGSPENIKQTLNDSGIYDELVTNITSQIQNKVNSEQGSSQDIPLDNPEVQKAINKAFPSSFWQGSAEQIVDGVYGWLDGDEAKIVFKVDIEKSKQTFINSLADYVVARAETLPVCTSPTQVTNPEDLFNLPCRPPDFDAKAARNQFVLEAEQGEFLGENSTFDASDLSSSNGNQRPIEEQFAPIKQGYGIAKNLPLALGIAAILLTVSLFFLHESRIKAISRLRTIYLSVGISILIFVGISWIILKQLEPPSIQIGAGAANSELQQSILNTVDSVYNTVITPLFIGSVIYIMVGIVLWIIAKQLSKPLNETQKHNNVNTVLHTKELNNKNAVTLENPDSATTESSTDSSTEVTDNSSSKNK